MRLTWCVCGNIGWLVQQQAVIAVTEVAVAAIVFVVVVVVVALTAVLCSIQ